MFLTYPGFRDAPLCPPIHTQLHMGDTAAADSMVASAHLMARGSLRTMVSAVLCKAKIGSVLGGQGLGARQSSV